MNSFNMMSSNEVVRTHRSKIPALNHFNITELHKMPELFDWVDCRVNDEHHFKMLLGGKDDGVAMRFFWNGQYEAATLRAWVYFASKSNLILDIGAHTGAYTLAALSASSGENVFSFEPHFMNFARLNLNLRGNGFKTSNSHMVAVGDKTEIRNFSISTNINYLSTGGSLDKKTGSFTSGVQVVNLDKTFATSIHEQIKLVKIDVEGHEDKCLEGMSNIIKVAKPIIFFECIDVTSGQKVEHFLLSKNYIIYEIDDITGKISETNKSFPYLDTNGQPVMHKINRISVPSQQRLTMNCI
ncbi:MAG: FkbM family methyltransferase [Magnetococcales bacterium]|nr:FkbM family methyltransferase [Magnetococcales bacterium]